MTLPLKKSSLIQSVSALALALPLAGFAGSPIAAQDYSDAFQKHWYVGGQIGGHDFEGDFKKFDILTGRAIAGFQMHPNFAVEMNLVGYEKLKAALNYTDGFSIERLKVEYSFSPEIDLLAKTSIHVTNAIDLFAKLGVGFYNEEVKLKYVGNNPHFSFKEKAKVDKDRVDLVAAAGVAVNLTDNFSIDASLIVNHNDQSRIDTRYTPSIGVTYRFI